MLLHCLSICWTSCWTTRKTSYYSIADSSILNSGNILYVIHHPMIRPNICLLLRLSKSIIRVVPFGDCIINLYHCYILLSYYPNGHSSTYHQLCFVGSKRWWLFIWIFHTSNIMATESAMRRNLDFKVGLPVTFVVFWLDQVNLDTVSCKFCT